MVWCVLLLVGLAVAEPHMHMQPQVWPFYLPLSGNNKVKMDKVGKMQYLEDVPRVGRTGPEKSQQQQSASPGRAKTVLEKMSAFSASDFAFDLLGSTPLPADDRGSVGRFMRLMNFPALVDQGVSLTHVVIQPCSAIMPHYHPRATELTYMIRGSNLTVSILGENGGKNFILRNGDPGWAVFLPQGTIHAVLVDCDATELVVFHNHEDPGSVHPISRATSLPKEVLEAALGQDSETVEDIIKEAPATISAPNPECMKRCGLL